MNKYINKHNWCGGKKKYKGFSFIESMLAVFLVSVGLITALKLLTAGIKDSMNSRDQFIASLLAQEGVELVRNIRDNNWVDNDPTTGSFYGISDDTCNIAYNSAISCNSPDFKLYLNNNNYYDHTPSGGTPTKFKREIIIKDVLGSKDIMSMVTWGGTSFPAKANCNTANTCSYTEITLNKWGE
jgi:hypothetical protein